MIISRRWQRITTGKNKVVIRFMNNFKYDLHVHTDEVSSCGRVKAREVVKYYKKAGYTGIVITDHFYEGLFDSIQGTWEEKINRYLVGYRKARQEGKKLNLQVLPGMELRFPENANDYLVYGVDQEFLIENPDLYQSGLEKFNKLITDKDIIIYQAHPFRPGLIPANPDFLTGIEVHNGNPRHESRNDLAYKYAVDNELAMISGSDFHQPEDLARGGVILPEKVTTPQQLVNILKRKQIELITTGKQNNILYNAN